ncbi:protein translocase subunit SecA-like [Sebastes umbrosus]|uniref:protein translocase subunit SecA-like n=1 Tax=Sebastes umbrosus TaxID=72105 RepID=UPI00189E931B|nr:protein translocase subunit SecA-like [Sebastes umbrosus]
MAESDTVSRLGDLLNTFRTLLHGRSLLSPKELLNKLQGLVTNIKWSPADATHLFDDLLKRFESTTTNDRSDLLSWMIKMLHCIEINYITPSWKSQRGKTLIDLVRDETVTDEALKECLAYDTEKQLEEILEEIRQQELNQIDEKLLGDVKDIVSSVDKDLKDHNDGSQRSGLKKVLLKLCRAVEEIQKYRPRLTQMVSWCIMALSKTGRLIQVGTGEGKSCIVAMFAAFRAMRGEQVDIFTSSSVLAERDLVEWRNFYKVLKISVDCNTNKHGKDELKKCYDCQVVYGTAHEFAGHWLNQHFERMDIFGKIRFQCAIVDEVDSLMLDKGHDLVYIGSDMPALQHLNPLLAFIWNTANQYRKIGTEAFVGQKYPFHQVVLEKISKDKNVEELTILKMAEDTGILTKGSVKDLQKDPGLLTEKTASVTANQLAKFFETVERRFPSCLFDLHYINNDGAIEGLNEGPQKEAQQQRVPLLLLNGGFCQYMYSDTESILSAAEAKIKCALHFTPCELSKDGMTFYVPGFLSDLVDSKLKVWIKNAFEARTMTMGHEYIIEEHGVVPVDYSSTGVVENFRTWSDGLHQFLEMKHMSKLSDMTAITNYMSTVGLFLKYGDQIFGISGTLGQKTDTEILQKIYEGIKTCQIPSFKRRKLFEVEGVIVSDEEEWIEKTCDVVSAKTNPTPYRAQRAVLVICETINRAKVLYRALGYKVQKEKLYISNNMDNSEVFQGLQPGDIIVATNLAGRGMDLKVSNDVNTAGGLFVVQTFLPENARVEAQAFGRTARQGSPGSAQLIVCSSHLQEPLKLLALLGKLQSSLENMTNVLPHLFVMQFRSYQKRHSNEQSNGMSSTLSRILTKNSNSGIKSIKQVRDDLATKRLATFLECVIPNIKKKEELFSLYLDTLDEVYESSNNKPADSDLSALNEFWGMWLLTNLNENKSISDLKDKLSEDLKTARQKLRRRDSPSSNLHHYTAFGNDLRKKGNLADSIEMYTKAIQEDHCWAAIAYYNRAFASLTRDRHQDRNCIDQALEDLQNALKSVELYLEQIEVTLRYSTQVKELCSDSVTRFDHHMITRHKVLLCFKGNITDAIRKVDRARDIGGNVKVEESPVHFMVPAVYFLPSAVLSIASLNLIRSRDPLKLLHIIRHPHFDIINELRCLKSLGLTHVYTLDTLFSLGGFFSKIHKTIFS